MAPFISSKTTGTCPEELAGYVLGWMLRTETEAPILWSGWDRERDLFLAISSAAWLSSLHALLPSKIISE